MARIGRGALGRVQNPALKLVTAAVTPERLADLALRAGPYGLLARGPRRGLTLATVKRARHGIDLGPLTPRLPDLLATPETHVRLAPEAMLAEAARLETIAAEPTDTRARGFDLTLIGRRQLRSNNSWMHDAARLMKGEDRGTALLHPEDAVARSLADGDRVRISSRIGSIELPVSVSDEIRPGVVWLPHGFGHSRAGVSWRRAAEHAGASLNDITDATVLDGLTGNAAFNAVPVRVEAIATTPARNADTNRQAVSPSGRAAARPALVVDRRRRRRRTVTAARAGLRRGSRGGGGPGRDCRGRPRGRRRGRSRVRPPPGTSGWTPPGDGHPPPGRIPKGDRSTPQAPERPGERCARAGPRPRAGRPPAAARALRPAGRPPAASQGLRSAGRGPTSRGSGPASPTPTVRGSPCR